MTTRALKVHAILAEVDIYVPDKSGEWTVPIPRGLLLSIHHEGESWPPRVYGFIAVESGAIYDHPLEWLRVVGEDNEQPSPPEPPAEKHRKEQARLEAEMALRGPVRKRRAPRKAVPK